MLTMLWRMPVRIEATMIAVITPTTMPRTVRKLRNLLARTLSSAILRTSIGSDADKNIVTSVLRQCHDRVELRCLVCRIEAGYDPDKAGHSDAEDHVRDRDGHSNFSQP